MQEVLEQVLDYLKGIWLKRRYIIIATWLICPVGWFWVAQMPDIYKSSARVHADTQSILRPLLRGLTIETNPKNQISLMTKTLLIRTNLERIARMTDLDINANTPEKFENIIANLRTKIKISLSRGKGANFFNISYTATDPEITQKVVQAALTVFIENTLGEDRQDNDSAQEFLDEQIREYERRLSEAESKVTIYKQKYNDILPGAGGYYAELKAEKQRLAQAKLELQELETQLVSAREQLANSSTQPSTISDNIENNDRVETTYDKRIEALDLRLDTLLLKFTDKHPDVIEAQRLQAHLKKLRKQEIDTYYASLANENTNDALGSRTISSNPILQEMQIQVNQLENQAVSLRVRVQSFQTKVDNLQNLIHTVPEIEAEFTALNRDYEVIKKKYTLILNRKETASLAQVASENTNKIEFKVLEAPQVPTKPIGSKHTLYFAGITVFGFAAGIGLSFLFSQINPVVTSSSQLSKATGIPILGVVSAAENMNLKKWQKRKTLLFITSNILLIFILAFFVSYSLFPELIQAPLKRVF